MIFVRSPLRYILPLLVVTAIFAQPGSAENFTYESQGKRDPFVPLIGVDRPSLSKLEDITSIADVRLEGIASKSGGKMVAILNGEIAREGDKFGDIEIRKITKDTVTIFMGGHSYDKNLGEEGGKTSGR